jgi:hypothetical protein
MKKDILHRVTGIVCFFCVLFLSSAVGAQTFDKIMDQVKEQTISNGMKFIVLERHDAPVASFHIYADVGSANETYGITGISHLLEHMAFKGTKTVGTKDYGQESKLLDQLDALYDQIRRERETVKPDSMKLAGMRKTFEDLRLQAKE